jgi:predicted phage terminase large subunit-like protein
MAKGALQAMRGVKWEHKRPDLLIGDDLENDEMVMNDDRRAKFSDWFHKVWIPIRADDGIVRVVGTILHEDSLLNGVINSKSWHSALFKAHNSFNDFGDILWPEQWSEPKLRQERQLFIDAGTPEGYSQEYLNDPADSDSNYFKRDDFVDGSTIPGWITLPRTYYIGIDLAISKQDRRAFTAMVVAGVDPSGGFLDIMEVRKGRWDTYEILENVFELAGKYLDNLDEILFENGHIFLAIEPTMQKMMEETGLWFGYDAVTCSTDKLVRGRSIQQRHRANRIRFDKSKSWYGGLEDEMVKFPRGAYMDQVDALSLIGMRIPHLVNALTQDETDHINWENEMDNTIRFVDNNAFEPTGIDTRTGY